VSARAGIVVTGTEVLTGRVADRNGPWLADRLEELGVDLAQITIVGDRREDLLAALRFMAAQRFDVVLTSGGLGPTADDLTAEVVAEFQGRELVWNGPLQERIEAIVARLGARWRNVSADAMREGARKQATIPRGATVLDPVGTAPGLVVTPAEGLGRPPTPTVVVLPGPPRELQPMWEAAVREDFRAAGPMREALAGATVYRRRTLRLFGIPESEIAETLRAAEHEGVPLERLEVTTCLKRGEVEVVTRYELGAQATYDALVGVVRARHAEQLFSEDGSTIDEQVAALLAGTGMRAEGECPPAPVGTGMLAGTGMRAVSACPPAPVEGECPPAPVGEQGVPTRTIATAESCTGGLLVARLTDPPGASRYVRGGIVAYSDEAKVEQAGVPAELIERHGAVSAEVAEALAEGARERLGADVGVGVTGIAGPAGGTPEKPVGTVYLCVIAADGSLARAVTLPGGRPDVRERTITVALHMVRRLLSPKASH
jgi:nicotinamide-nucleotide amidase